MLSGYCGDDVKQVLTDRTLRALKPAPTGKRTVLWDAALPAFGVRITDKGKTSFFVMRRRQGDPKPVRIVLGSYPFLPLADARQKAREALADLAMGVHPAQKRADQKAAEKQNAESTVRGVVEAFTARHLATKRTGVAIAQILQREVVARWGDQPISKVTRADVVRAIEDMAASSPSAALKAAIYIKRVFSWAMNRGTPGLTSSPCNGVSISDLIGSPKTRERVLTDQELRALWETTAANHFPFDPFARLLSVLGCRRGELAGMTRRELNLKAGLWHLPGDRTKNEMPRTVPLPRLAVEIISALPQFDGQYVFTTTGGLRPISGFSKLKSRLDRRMAEAAGAPFEGWTLHDLRRTMRTHLSALPISGVVAELMIGHKQRGVTAIYDRYSYLEEQRGGFELWASRLAVIVAHGEARA